MNRQEYWNIREKIGFTVDLYRYAKTVGEIIEAYPILKKMSLEDVEQWLKDRQFRIDQEIENELVDGESNKEKQMIKELNEAISEMSEKLSKNNIDIQFNKLNNDQVYQIQTNIYDWIKKCSDCFQYDTDPLDDTRHIDLSDKWEITFDTSLVSLFRPDLFKVKLTPVKPMTLPVNPDYEKEFLTTPKNKIDNTDEHR